MQKQRGRISVMPECVWNDDEQWITSRMVYIFLGPARENDEHCIAPHSKAGVLLRVLKKSESDCTPMAVVVYTDGILD